MGIYARINFVQRIWYAGQENTYLVDSVAKEIIPDASAIQSHGTYANATNMNILDVGIYENSRNLVMQKRKLRH